MNNSITRKVLLTSLFSLLCLTVAMAQNSALCGDWIGVYESGYPHPTEDRYVEANYKLYVRIKQQDGKYYVRMKTRIADERFPFSYQPECQVIDVTPTSITFSQLWCDEKGGDLGTENGRVVWRDFQIARYKAVFSNGILKLSGEYERTCYDRQGNKIYSHCFSDSYRKGISLYKEENEW